MKKILAIAMAVVMLFAMTVVVSADEVLYSEDCLFFSAGNWNAYELKAEIIDALATEGAVLVVTRSTEFRVEFTGEEGGPYEKFCFNDTWYSGLYYEANNIQLGTAGHTAEGEPGKGIIDCLKDDGVKVYYDGNAIYNAWIEGNFNAGGAPQLISNTSAEDAYDIINVSVIIPSEPIVSEAPAEEAPAEEPAPETEAPAEEPAPETEAPAEDTPAEEAPAETGLALAVIPTVVAMAAVVISKKR